MAEIGRTMETYKKYLNEENLNEADNNLKAQKEAISYLEKIRKAIPKAISEFKSDKISTAAGLMHSMSNISNTDFYEHYFG
jgi:DNA-directed RNA polymerase subunit F